MSANNKSNSLLRPRPNPASNSVLYKDQTTRHVATVNPNNIRFEKTEEIGKVTGNAQTNAVRNELEKPAVEGSKPFKVIKLTGRNPIIFSPERLPELQTYLKSGMSPQKDEQNVKSPVIKVKSVDNLNNESPSGESGVNRGSSESANNLDIIHSVGLMRKAEKTGGQNNSKPYSRSYSWNKPKAVNKQTCPESNQCEAQTKHFEIEETWNDIKQENIDGDYDSWANSHGHQEPQINDRTEDMCRTPPIRESPYRASKDMWNKVNEAKLDLIAYQRKLLEEQHKKNLEYMKREHDMKMSLLKAEIDLKRKQFNMLM